MSYQITTTKDKLNIKNYKYNCVRLSIIAGLYPVDKDGTSESKYVSNLIDDYELSEGDYEYITRMQDKYKFNISIYKTCGNIKVEISVIYQIFSKDRKNVRLLVWNGHCALNKNLDELLERPSTTKCKLWHCDNCEYWYDSEVKYIEHKCYVQIKPKIVCPTKKHNIQELSQTTRSRECFIHWYWMLYERYKKNYRR